MNRQLVLVLGFVAAAIGATVACASLIAGLSIVDTLHDIDDGPQQFLRIFVLSGAIAMPLIVLGGLLLGLPLHVVMARRDVRDHTTYLVTGAVAGGLLGVVNVGFLSLTTRAMLAGAAIGAVTGLVAAFVWWFSVVRVTARVGNP